MAILPFPKKPEEKKDLRYLVFWALIPFFIGGLVIYFVARPSPEKIEKVPPKEILEIKDKEEMQKALSILQDPSFQSLVSPPGYLFPTKEDVLKRERGKRNPFE